MRIGRYLVSIFMPLLVYAVPGCGGGGGSSEYSVGQVQVTVLHPRGATRSGSKSQGDFDTTTFQFSDPAHKSLTIIVDHGRLRIDDQDFGELNPKDEIVIDARLETPTVKINGVDRQAEMERERSVNGQPDADAAPEDSTS
jgi:hypothetical protein